MESQVFQDFQVEDQRALGFLMPVVRLFPACSYREPIEHTSFLSCLLIQFYLQEK